MTAHSIYRLNGQVLETRVSGETADISPFALFQWYEWVYFRDTTVSFPDDTMVLGRDLGPAIDIGPAMTRKILKANGRVVYQSTVRALGEDEMNSPIHEKEREQFDAHVAETLGESYRHEDFASDPHLEDLNTPTYDYHLDADEHGIQLSTTTSSSVNHDVTPDTIDPYVGARVNFPIGDETMKGIVRCRKRGHDGGLRGMANKNPALDTRIYSVTFDDGQTANLAANMIAQNMYARVDTNGNEVPLFQGIIDHCLVSRTRRHIPDRTVTHLCVEWKDGSTTWEQLARVQESHPLDLAEYINPRGSEIDQVRRWAAETLKSSARVVAASKTRYHRRTHKFGIEIPKTFEDCLRLDSHERNTLWQDAIRKEMDKVRVAFKVLGKDRRAPPGYQQIRCHMIYDVKMENFQRKARLVAGGHMTDTPPAHKTYASVFHKSQFKSHSRLQHLTTWKSKPPTLKMLT